MTAYNETIVKDICRRFGNERSRMMDVVKEVQTSFGHVPNEAMDAIARALSCPRVEVQSLVSFYAFLTERPKGNIIIRLCDDVIDRMQGFDRIADAFKEELGIGIGETTTDGKITLEATPCIGMCDQAPAALINDVIVTNLTKDAAREIVAGLREHGDPQRLVKRLGDGNNAHELVRAMVVNNVRRKGDVIFGEGKPSDGLKNALAMSPVEVIRAVKTSRLRGRGGAGFPTGIKWEFTRAAKDETRYVICNADEGEPGTFKDRVILTEKADLLFEGMTIAGYAIGAQAGILYLRAEYVYLRPYLEHALAERRKSGLLGNKILGHAGFNYDIRIQMGAGAYICGEETSLISSAEGFRGDPKTRPPFPAQKGYMGHPSAVNNVETLCCVTRILERGAGWYAQMGSNGTSGTKLLSVSGDCKIPGVYEIPFGITLKEFLAMAGAEDAAAVQVGGPSGQMVGPAEFNRIICYDDLATGGAIMVFGPQRDLLWVVSRFMEFFVEESCGYCTPCRVGNVLLRRKIEEVRAGKCDPAAIAYLEDLGQTVKIASRCGLGQTSANPVLTTLKNFRPLYTARMKENEAGMQMTFDISAAVRDAEIIAGRKSANF